MAKCKESIGGIKACYIANIPIDITKLDLMSELNIDQADEVRKKGIKCIILSVKEYNFISKVKDLINDAENSAEECFQELNDSEQGQLYMAKVTAYKEVIELITGGKPILNDI
jgi:hypothetical protein